MPSRRDFLHLSGATLAGSSILSTYWLPLSLASRKEPSIQDVIELIIQACGKPKEQTVDTVKSGDPQQPLKGVVTTFLATTEVIKQAIELGANLIITHEPTYYNHLDETDWLKEDAVYQHKRNLLEGNDIVVWRFHDYWHRHQPDGILHGFLKHVQWQEYQQKENPNICIIPGTSLQNLTTFFKKSVPTERIYFVGNPEIKCQKIGFLLGAYGGRRQIQFLSTADIDVLVVGEIAEWETCEYIRDANSAGIQKGLIILGHALSEEPGMNYLVDWLRPRLAETIGIHHVPANDPFKGVS